MKSIILVVMFSLSFVFSASAAKKQETPEYDSGSTGPYCPVYDCNEEPDRGPDAKHQETYEEGGDRGGSSDDGYQPIE